MNLKRIQENWHPMREIEEMTNRLSRLFETSLWPFTEGESLTVADWRPSCNISETVEGYRVRAELPGVKKNDVHVMLQDGVLTIEGERHEEKEEKGEKFHRKELSYGNFMRRFTMPGDIEGSKVNATFKDGVLDILIAKSNGKKSKTQEVEIH